MVVERVWLEQVDDVEPVRLPRHGVGYSEVVPLGVAARVVVWLENQVIFKLIDLNCPAKVARFEARFKDQRLVIFEIWLVVWRQHLIVIAFTF